MKTTAAKCAKQVKKELREKFPDTKFSVISDNFAGGNAVRIKYEDGPTIDQLREVVDKYQYGHFNGMEDIYEYSNGREDVEQVKYVTWSRRMSDETKEMIIKDLQENYHGLENFDPEKYYEDWNCYGSTLLHRKFNDLSLIK